VLPPSLEYKRRGGEKVTRLDYREEQPETNQYDILSVAFHPTGSFVSLTPICIPLFPQLMIINTITCGECGLEDAILEFGWEDGNHEVRHDAQ
jgi:hypothetical protein